MLLDFFVKLKCRTSIIILSVVIKYSTHDPVCDVITRNAALSATKCNDLRALSSDVDILSFTRILPIRQLQAHAVTDDITN